MAAPDEKAEITAEYGPFPDAQTVAGVTYDGHDVWFAAGDHLQAIDAKTGAPGRRIAVVANAGTAFDGRHLFQISGDRTIRKIDAQTGVVLSSVEAQIDGKLSGLTWAEGTLWVGNYRNRAICQIDAETGKLLRTITSSRFVTGVTFVDGDLWHGTWEDDRSDLRRVDVATGEVRAVLAMPDGKMVSGLESDGADTLFCGSGGGRTVRAVRRPKQR